MNEEAIVQALETLASRLGVTAEYLWQVLVAQAHVEIVRIGMMWAVMVVVFALSIIYAVRFFNSKSFENREDRAIGGMIGFILICIVTLALAIIASEMAFDLPTLLLNPEYWALNEILDVIRYARP